MYRNSKSVSVLFSAVTLLGMLLPSVVSALGTPDGLPPPMEHICDAEKGAAYGLCNAFCQAMDCDSDTPSASEIACEKVAAKFTQVTARPIPCDQIQQPCPISHLDTFNELISNPDSVTSCTYDWNDDPQSLVVCSGEQDLVCNPLVSGSSALWAAVWQSGSGDDSYKGGDNTSGTFPLQPQEFNECKSLLESATTNKQIGCIIW